MANTDQGLGPISPLCTIKDLGYFGGANKYDCGVTICLDTPRACLLINLRKNQKTTLTKLLKEHYALSLPAPLNSENSKSISLRWFGFNQWLLVSNIENKTPFFDDANHRLSAAASVCDQSHGRTTITISGPRARALLEKGMPVDLHESNFRIGSCAITDIAHISVHICQTNTQEYEISCNRSFAQSLWYWLCEMSLEFGYKID